ncbi:MAG: acyl-CoA reductase [Chitinophagaceae bacterium]
MNVEQRIEILSRLRNYLSSNNESWQVVKEEAFRANPWFNIEFIELAVNNIINEFLETDKLKNWIGKYRVREDHTNKIVGIVMAGNIPLVGFHDFLCVFICGHKSLIKASSKDEVLIKHIVLKLKEWDASLENVINFAQTLKGCDAYIATGSNNSSRYFEFYFSKYPNIIRRNRTSVAVLTGNETSDELSLLAKDIQLYFGQGCRNVTHLFVPKEYDFIPLLTALKPYEYFLDFHKYRHNYDYQLALLMMNNKFYMTDGSVILAENDSIFSAISQVHYTFYENINTLKASIENNNDIQCIVGNEFTAFGKAQEPTLNEYADGVDTMEFLAKL